MNNRGRGSTTHLQAFTQSLGGERVYLQPTASGTTETTIESSARFTLNYTQKIDQAQVALEATHPLCTQLCFAMCEEISEFATEGAPIGDSGARPSRHG
jgi:hypothetical protein